MASKINLADNFLAQQGRVHDYSEHQRFLSKGSSKTVFWRSKQSDAVRLKFGPPLFQALCWSFLRVPVCVNDWFEFSLAGMAFLFLDASHQFQWWIAHWEEPFLLGNGSFHQVAVPIFEQCDPTHPTVS